MTDVSDTTPCKHIHRMLGGLGRLICSRCGDVGRCARLENELPTARDCDSTAPGVPHSDWCPIGGDNRRWCWENGTRYCAEESREEAIATAVFALALRESPNGHIGVWTKMKEFGDFEKRCLETIRIGRINPYRFSLVGYGDAIMELMRQDAEDNAGTEDDDWPDAPETEVAVLMKELDVVLQAWLERTGNQPTFGEVSDLEKPTPDEIEDAIATLLREHA